MSHLHVQVRFIISRPTLVPHLNRKNMSEARELRTVSHISRETLIDSQAFLYLSFYEV